eukprot:g28515.t1
MKPILTPPDDTGHEGGENANSSANKPKVGDEVPAQPDEVQKSIDTIISDQQEKDKLFNAITQVPTVAQKAK